MMKHDVVIIGGSLAGSSCARTLRSRGVDAVAFERDGFPREKVCGGFLSPAAVGSLEELGVLGAVLEAGAVWVRSARVRGFGTDFTIPFDPPGLGISRRKLDHILAQHARIEERVAVIGVKRRDEKFDVSLLNQESVQCRVLVDAAGKLSRFTKRNAVEEYGVQLEEAGDPGHEIDFWFSEDSYGGSNPIEGHRKNICYLVRKPALRRWLAEREWLVTGPLAYDRVPGEYLSIGDAAGMVDPFCGDGMGHALASGILAAHVIAEALDHGRTYEQMRVTYENEWSSEWSRKRALSGAVRAAIQHRRIAPALFRLAQAAPGIPRSFLRKVWAA